MSAIGRHRPTFWITELGAIAWRAVRAAGVTGRALVIMAPAAWLTLFFVVPLAVVFGISLTVKQFGQPPYSDLITTEEGTVQLTLHLSNYLRIFSGATTGPEFWIGLAAWAGAATVLFLIARALGDRVHWAIRVAAYGLAAIAAGMFLQVLYSANLGIYLDSFLSSIRIAAVATAIAALIGYPMAYAIARAPDRWRNVLLMLVILPFWTSFLLRVYALSGFMRGEGVINNTLQAIGFQHVIDQMNGALLALGLTGAYGWAVPNLPFVMMQTDFAIYVGVVYTYLPFFILPLYTSLVKLDPALLEASADLGARPVTTFLSVTLPLSMPGVIAGAMLVFIPTIGEFVIPSLLGGPGTQMIGRVLWDEFFSKTNWPRAAALAITLLVVVVIPIVLMQRAQSAVVERG